MKISEVRKIWEILKEKKDEVSYNDFESAIGKIVGLANDLPKEKIKLKDE